MPQHGAILPEMRQEDLRRWVSAQRAVEARERRDLAAQPPEPEVAWNQALSLIALLGRLIGWPPPEDETRRREDEYASAQWTRLRAAYRWRHDR